MTQGELTMGSPGGLVEGGGHPNVAANSSKMRFINPTSIQQV